MDLAHFAGSTGSLWIDGGKVMFADQGGTRELPIPEDLRLPPAPPITADPRHETPRWKMLVGVELAPYTVLCRALKAKITGDPPPSPVVPATFADGLAAMEIIDAARTSAAEGGKVIAVPQAPAA